jgi:hypothetical protein
MNTPQRVTLLLGLCAASGALLWLLLERGDAPSPGVSAAAEVEEADQSAPSQNKSIVAAAPRAGVKTLCGIIGDGSSAVRLAAAHALPTDLTASEYELILKHVLRAPKPEGMYYRAWHAVFNDTLNALVRRQKVRIETLPAHLRAIMQDAECHVVIRDYALQHLMAYAEFRMGAGERLALIDSIWPEVQEGGHSLPGSYLLALLHTPDVEGWPSKAETAQRAWELLQNEQTHILSRITALQTCGQLGYKDALPLALEIAADSKAHMTLRTAAIATIGNLGAANEVAYLTNLNQQVPPRLQVAVKAALQRLKKG